MTSAPGPRRFRVLDHQVEIGGPPDVTALFDSILAPLASPEADRPVPAPVEHIVAQTSASGGTRVTADGIVLFEATDRGRLVAGMLEHLNQRAAASVRAGIPLHAAAIAAANGGVVALAGPSGSGKSTLCAAAVSAGWGFVADEVAVVVDGRRVRPFHRPIGLRRGGSAAIGLDHPDEPWFTEVRPWVVPAERRVAGGELLGIVVVARHAGSVPAVIELDPPVALAEMVRHVVVPDDDRLRPVFRGLDRLVRDVPVVRATFDRPHDGLERVAELVRRWAQ